MGMIDMFMGGDMSATIKNTITDIMKNGIDPVMMNNLKEIAGEAHSYAMKHDKIYRDFITGIIKESVREYVSASAETAMSEPQKTYSGS